MPNNIANKDRPQNLFLRLTAGDPEAFDYYYKSYRSALLKMAMRFLDNRQAAEDIVSDTFVTLYKKRTCFQSEEHLLHFLNNTNYNKCQNYLRHQKIWKKFEIGNDLAEKYADTDIIEIEQRLICIYEQLASAIARLPPLKKKVMRLYFYEKKKTKYIASHLRVAEQTVRNQLTKAKVIVKKSLDRSSTTLRLK